MSSQPEVSETLSKIAFIPVHESQTSVYNFKDLKRRFDAFMQDTYTKIYEFPGDLTGESIHQTHQQAIFSAYHDLVYEDKKAQAPEKKEKKESKPIAPSAYMLFSKDKRAEVIAEDPSLTFAQIGTALGKKWAALTDAEKKVYQDRSAELKVQLEQQLADGTYVKPVKKAKVAPSKEAKDAPKEAPKAATPAVASPKPAPKETPVKEKKPAAAPAAPKKK